MPEPTMKLLAWEGIACAIPVEWSPTILSGDRGRGFVRISDLEAIRMEIRWEPLKGAWEASPVVDRYESLLKKAARKSRTELSIRREEDHEPSDGARLVVEEPSAVSYHRLMLWPDDRVVFARVETRPRRDRKLARRILDSLASAARESRELWSVFGLTMRPVIGWSRTENRLSTGILRLGFGRDSRRLIVEQQSLGTELVRDRGLERLLDALCGQGEMRRQAGQVPSRWLGHEVLARVGRGRPPTRRRKARSLAGILARRVRRRRDVAAGMWLCPVTDKVFSVTGFGMTDIDDVLAEAGVACHEGDGP